MPIEKPKGIKVFGIIQIIYSAFTSLSTSFSILFITAVLPVSPSDLGVFNPFSLTMIFMFLQIIVGLIGLIAAIGVLMTKSWARKMLIGVAISILVISVFGIIATYLSQQYIQQSLGQISDKAQAPYSIISLIPSFIGFIIKSVYCVWLIIYFNKIEVKQAFNQSS